VSGSPNRPTRAVRPTRQATGLGLRGSAASPWPPSTPTTGRGGTCPVGGRRRSSRRSRTGRSCALPAATEPGLQRLSRESSPRGDADARTGRASARPKAGRMFERGGSRTDVASACGHPLERGGSGRWPSNFALRDRPGAQVWKVGPETQGNTACDARVGGASQEGSGNRPVGFFSKAFLSPLHAIE
jgi:hypothetical protein